MKLLLIGHSHSAALARALSAPPDPGWKTIGAWRFEHANLKRDPYHGLLRDARGGVTECGHVLAERIETADAMILCLEGNYHNAVGMIERKPRFDFFGEPADAPPCETRWLIPNRVMTQVFVRCMNSTQSSPEGIVRSSFLDVLAFVRERSRRPAVLLEPPPPVPDPEKIARFRPGAGRVTPFAIRRKLWRLQCSIMKQYCLRFEVDYLPVPVEAVDSDGKLDPRAYEGVNDPTHMNSWYGRLVMRQIDAWLGQKITISDPGERKIPA